MLQNIIVLLIETSAKIYSPIIRKLKIFIQNLNDFLNNTKLISPVSTFSFSLKFIIAISVVHVIISNDY